MKNTTPQAKAARARSERAGIPRDRQILEAAVRVFAERGYHAARVSDIAREAGVAYGLVYHYYDNKQQILECIFERTWSQLLQGLKSIDESGESGQRKLAEVVRLMLGSYRLAPELVRVLVIEVTRSGHLRESIHEITAAFQVIEHMIAAAQAAGEFRDDVDAKLASYTFWGAIDEIVSGWAFGTLPSDDHHVSEAERTVVAIILGGLVRVPHAASSAGQATA